MKIPKTIFEEDEGCNSLNTGHMPVEMNQKRGRGRGILCKITFINFLLKIRFFINMSFIFLVDYVPRSFIAHADTDANVNADAKAVIDAEAEAVADAEAEAVAEVKGDSNTLANPKTKSVVNVEPRVCKRLFYSRSKENLLNLSGLLKEIFKRLSF